MSRKPTFLSLTMSLLVVVSYQIYAMEEKGIDSNQNKVIFNEEDFFNHSEMAILNSKSKENPTETFYRYRTQINEATNLDALKNITCSLVEKITLCDYEKINLYFDGTLLKEKISIYKDISPTDTHITDAHKKRSAATAENEKAKMQTIKIINDRKKGKINDINNETNIENLRNYAHQINGLLPDIQEKISQLQDNQTIDDEMQRRIHAPLNGNSVNTFCCIG